MTDRGLHDDSGYQDAVQQADRATRFGWMAIAGVSGLLGIVLIAVAVGCLVVAVAFGYAVAVMD